MAASADRNLNQRLYHALMDKQEDQVLALCRRETVSDGPLQITSIHKDTVLHLACYSKQHRLALELTEMLPPDAHPRLTKFKNDVGNTILHEAATCNDMEKVVRSILAKQRKLLKKKNILGESPLFRAVRFGKTKMFRLLAEEVDKYCCEKGEDVKELITSKDKTSILHIAVINEHFDLAMLIANRYPYLIGKEDGNEMIALQHLACNPTAFQSGCELGFFKRLIYHCIPSKENTREGDHPSGNEAMEGDVKSCVSWSWELPVWEEVRMEKKKHISAWKLAKKLIKHDTSWEGTKPEALNHGKQINQEKGEGLLPKTETEGLSILCQQLERKKSGKCCCKESSKISTTDIDNHETPLFLATMWNIPQLVDEILETYPQTAEHINKKGRNILHIAIRYRQIKTFKKVLENEIFSRRLLRATDVKGNSILHMVAKKRKGHLVEGEQFLKP